MDDHLPQVNIIVSRIDTTSPMQLCIDLSSDLRAAGFQVNILEIKKFVNVRGLRSLFGMLDSTGDRDILLSCGALSDICTALLRVFGQRRQRSFVAYLHCHQWLDLKFERNILWSLIYYAMWRWSLYLKDQVSCVSFDIVNSLPRLLASRSRVVYNYVEPQPASMVDDSRYADISHIIDWISQQHRMDRKVVLGFGLFRRRKNFESLIHAVNSLSDVSLILVGGGPEERALRIVAQNLELQKRVMIHTFIPQPARLCVFADAYVSCSHSEGFGLANLEAASSGIPVILPCHAVNLEVLSDYSNVVFYNPRAQSHLAEEIGRVLVKSSRYQRQERPNRFSRTAFSNQWLRFITLLNNRYKDNVTHQRRL